MVVGTNSGGNYIKAGEIALAINQSTGQSEALINADKIVIGELSDEDLDSWALEAKNGTGTFAKFLTVRQLTAQEITTMLADIDDATIGALNVTGNITADTLTSDDGITTPDIMIGSHLLDENALDNYIVDATARIGQTKSKCILWWSFRHIFLLQYGRSSRESPSISRVTS